MWAKLGGPLAAAGGCFQGRRVRVDRNLMWYLGQGQSLAEIWKGEAGQFATMAKERVNSVLRWWEMGPVLGSAGHRYL